MDQLEKKKKMMDLKLFSAKSMVAMNAVLPTSVEYVRMLQLIQMIKDNVPVAYSLRKSILVENVNPVLLQDVTLVLKDKTRHV